MKETGCLHWIGLWLVCYVRGLPEFNSLMWEDPACCRQLHSLGRGPDYIRAEDGTEHKQAVFLPLAVAMM